MLGVIWEKLQLGSSSQVEQSELLSEAERLLGRSPLTFSNLEWIRQQMKKTHGRDVPMTFAYL